ncbi:MAG: ParD-like family protein [Rhodospirillales bacterium]|nr:ParD-like family protein [Rhodospirillales bacterium]
MSVNVKLSEELVALAKRHGGVSHRSLPKQIEHWSLMGKIAEENPDLPYALIKDILIARGEEADEAYVFD